MSKQHFRRYTNLIGVLAILTRKEFTLLDPNSWDDRNDVFAIKEFQRRINAKSIHALCFSQEFETYHHWRIFSPGTDGVCVNLNKMEVLKAFSKDPRIKHKAVDYRSIDSLRHCPPQTIELPFVKRIPYAHEAEYRVIHADCEKKQIFPKYGIDLNCIESITLSPWTPSALVETTREVIKSIDGCGGIRVFQTTVIDNEDWKKICSIN